MGQIERAYELDDLSNPNVPRFEQFRDEVKALNNWDRVFYQDDSVRDPSSEFASDDEAAVDTTSPNGEVPAEAVLVKSASPTK